MPKIRNIIIFVSIAAVFVLIYIFYIKSSAPASSSSLVSSTPNTTLPNVNTGVSTGGADATAGTGSPFVAKDFLTLLLNVKNIKLDNSIFSDPAFNSLHDSSITLTQDITEQGRPNPFAPFGNDATPVAGAEQSGAKAVCTLPQVADMATNTCITPATGKSKL